jgi:hypothetical protein
MRTRRSSKRQSAGGQALVEFCLASMVFFMLFMGIVDAGRGIYEFNSVSQAARDISRVTSVHPGSTLGTSSQTLAVIATQDNLIPDMQAPTFTCVDITGAPISRTCTSGDFVKVVVAATFRPVTPILSFLSSWNLQSSSIVQIP